MIRIHFTAKEQRRDVDTVRIVNDGPAAACQRGQCRHEVREIHLITDLAGWHPSGLIHDEGHLDTALIELSLTAFQSCTAIQFLQWGHYGSTIVGGKDDQCVLAEAQIVERTEQPSDIVVHVRHKSSIALGVHRPLSVLIIP